MDILTTIMLVFSVLGGIDRICGNRLGLGKEFDRGFMVFGNMALSMIGMIILSPALAEWLKPVFDFTYNVLRIDPSIIPATLFANDMGGAPLAIEIAKNEQIGRFNALVVSAMMGATISYTIPLSLEMVEQRQHKELMLGLLYGVVTIPIGCFVSGLVCKIPVLPLIVNLLPLLLFSVIVAVGLMKFPTKCIKIFKIMGYGIRAIITFGLLLGIIRFLSGKEIIKGLETIESGAAVCLNASIVISGAFPFIYTLSKILSKPLGKMSKKLGINKTSAIGLVSILATCFTMFSVMSEMDKKGVVLNSAFAVSAAFTFAGHLAFTFAYDSSFVLPMIIGKLVSGLAAVVLAAIAYRKSEI